jgi:peptide/nickel transport system permease protein
MFRVLAPWISPYDPTVQDLKSNFLPPSRQHLLGTDIYGRGILSRIIGGSRASLQVAAISITVSSLVGAGIGLTAGYLGGKLESAAMRVMDIMMSFPLILLAILVVAVLGRGMLNLTIAIGVSNVPRFARLARSEVLARKSLDYITAARATGATNSRVIMKHLLPNTLPTLVVLGTMRVSQAILSEASLSFLGLGVSPPTPSWGAMVAEGCKYLMLSPWTSIPPGGAIMLAILGLNLLGDGLRDALDPELRHETAKE